MKNLIMMMMFMFMVGILKFCFNKKNLLVSLLILEYIVLMMFLLLYFCLNMMYENYFSMMYIVVCVCESVLGLSVLVSMIRTHGSDYFLGYNMLQCY
nr:NADH dehydrogenase subunit 4L [Aviostivalius klossi bispiniformis]